MRHDDLIKTSSSSSEHTINMFKQKVEIPTPPWPNMETVAIIQFNGPIMKKNTNSGT